MLCGVACMCVCVVGVACMSVYVHVHVYVYVYAYVCACVCVCVSCFVLLSSVRLCAFVHAMLGVRPGLRAGCACVLCVRVVRA